MTHSVSQPVFLKTSDKTNVTAHEDASGQATENGPRHRQVHRIADDFEDEGDSLTLCGYGDVSFSEAYNTPAPTTGNYPLRPKHSRPPKPSRLGTKMHLPLDDDDDVSGNSHNEIVHTIRPSPAQIPEETSEGAEDLSFTLDGSDDYSTSDILAFLEDFKAARDASLDIQAATTLALGHRMNNLNYLPSRIDSATGSEPIGTASGPIDANGQGAAQEAGRRTRKSNSKGTREPYTQRQGYSQRWEGSSTTF
ncbi:hypothetical protein PHLGIDRAFT_365231 [Phlebiopsis gigantea 11061_1 CR5-6]|uniref:Uncharacterized protein n=1 Tax=Phlebiopsis gigantea (strain 11061_1 CR5-6) TaxID=745531 RepID=A0A0C3PP35_PHLG1|nr:hypothetical protein PHLGIDRAFT_365231 [Phlebiopsis gigantea 11061_1 CR5-6]